MSDWAENYWQDRRDETVREWILPSAEAPSKPAQGDITETTHPECWYCGERYYSPPTPNGRTLDHGMCDSCLRDRRS